MVSKWCEMDLATIHRRKGHPEEVAPAFFERPFRPGRTGAWPVLRAASASRAPNGVSSAQPAGAAKSLQLGRELVSGPFFPQTVYCEGF